MGSNQRPTELKMQRPLPPGHSAATLGAESSGIICMNGHVLLVSCDLQKSVNVGLHSLVTLGGRGKKLSLGESKSGILCFKYHCTVFVCFVFDGNRYFKHTWSFIPNNLDVSTTMTSAYFSLTLWAPCVEHTNTATISGRRPSTTSFQL